MSQNSTAGMVHVTGTERHRLTLPKYRPLILGQGFGAAAAALDAAVIVALSVAAGIAWHLYAYGKLGDIADHANVGILTSLFYLLPRYLKGHYEISEMVSGRHNLRQSFTIWNFAFFCLLSVGFLAKLTDIHSRGAVVVFYLLGFAGVALVRTVVLRLFLRGFAGGWLATRRVLLVGTRAKVSEFVRRYAPRRYGLQVIDSEIVADSDWSVGGDQTGGLRPLLQRTVQRARTERIDDIVLLIPWSDAHSITACADALMTVPASVHLGPEGVFDRFAEIRLTRVGTATGLTLSRPPLSSAELLAKRILDLVAATAGLVLLSPLLMLVALAIKLDSPGPVLFLQRRHGFNQEPFRIIKFRTMTTCDDGPVVRQAALNDSRVTNVGKFLRRWNIDELPQLLNVIMGDMSIVGPRPHAMVHNDDFERRIALYARRHNVKPGITGWAQINGLRGETDTDAKMRARVEHDLYYIDNWSIWFDLYIMAMTLLSPRAFENAW